MTCRRLKIAVSAASTRDFNLSLSTATRASCKGFCQSGYLITTSSSLPNRISTVKPHFCNANVLPWHGAQFFWQELLGLHCHFGAPSLQEILPQQSSSLPLPESAR